MPASRPPRMLSLLLTMLLVLLSGLPLAQPAPLQAQAGEAAYTVTPSQITRRVELGSRQTFNLTITNTGGTEGTPRLYEAEARPPVLADLNLPAALQTVQLPNQAERIDPLIREQLAAAPNGKAEFLVFMDERPDLSLAYTMDDWRARGEYVYRTLTSTAEQSQRDLRAWLTQRNIAYTPLWIANALLVEGTQAELEALAARTDVAALRAEYALTLDRPDPLTDKPLVFDPSATDAISTAQASLIEWHITQIGAERVWQDFGITGQGVVVANIDSGVLGDHPALIRQYRGYRPDGSRVHAYNWFDPARLFSAPDDQNGHGTHVMGIMVGAGDTVTNRPAVGVAPGSQWVAARGCRTSSCTEADLILAAQWMLAPTNEQQRNPRPDLRPHIINGSFASAGGDNFYLNYVTAWRAAGIFPVFAAGNNGSRGCKSVGSPGDYVQAVGVGATNRTDQIATFSGRGPGSEGQLKPDVVAPGTQIRSTYIGSSQYTILQGTSMASPVVAGAVALLWSANPQLIGNYDETYRILISTTKPITDTRFTSETTPNCPALTVPNSIYGYGRIDVFAAVAEAQVDLAWLSVPQQLAPIAAGATANVEIAVDMSQISAPGTYQARVLVGTDDLTQALRPVDITITVPEPDGSMQVQGRVLDERTGTPLSGVAQIAGGVRVPVDADGNFRVTLPQRSQPYTVLVSSYQFVPQQRQIAGTVTGTVSLTFALKPDLPRISSAPAASLAALSFGGSSDLAVTIKNIGTQPLTYSLAVPTAVASVWRSDVPADRQAVRWHELPEDAYTFQLGDDSIADPLTLTNPLSFLGRSVEQVWVGSNGVILFDPPRADLKFFTPSCTSIPETTGAAVAPLRSDLNPALGGKIRAAEVPEGLLVSYEAVPLFGFNPEDGQNFTFQMLLRPDGRIQLNYRTIPSMTQYTQIALQPQSGTTQVLGCGPSTPVTGSLTLQLRPQMNATAWIVPSTTAKGSVAPNQTVAVPFALRGLPPLDATRIARGEIVITSNDPLTPRTIIPVEVTVGDAPYQFYLPQIKRAIRR